MANCDEEEKASMSMCMKEANRRLKYHKECNNSCHLMQIDEKWLTLNAAKIPDYSDFMELSDKEVKSRFIAIVKIPPTVDAWGRQSCGKYVTIDLLLLKSGLWIWSGEQ